MEPHDRQEPVMTAAEQQLEQEYLEQEAAYERQYIERYGQEAWDGYLKHCEESEREYQEEQRTGRRICPKCEQRSVKVTATPTRNYGGGWDTFQKCENESCDYAEVFV
jgi:hypothetical protein